MVTLPPPKCPLKRGLVYHVCSRLNNMSVSGIRTAPPELPLVQDGAPSVTPTPPLSQHPPPVSSLPSSAAVNNEWFPNCLSRFLPLISDTGKTAFSQHKHTARFYLAFDLVELGETFVMSCFSVPGSTLLAASVPPASQCKQCSGLLTRQMATLQPSGERIPPSFWKPPLPTGTHWKPTFSSLDGSLFVNTNVWNGATEHKEADIRHSANSTADIEFCVTVIDLFLWHIYLFMISFRFLCIYSVI